MCWEEYQYSDVLKETFLNLELEESDDTCLLFFLDGVGIAFFRFETLCDSCHMRLVFVGKCCRSYLPDMGQFVHLSLHTVRKGIVVVKPRSSPL